MSLPRRLAFIDVESTGAHPVRDRITEIAILRVEDGVLVERWESLVDPGIPIPPLIQQVTGITDDMVAGAPGFEALADRVQTLLADCVFVAHNARFDFGFIKNAFERIGRAFDARVLCTVKLSRALFPEHHRHGLDALIERHGLHCGARHRAMGDTEALWQFVQMAQAQFAPDVIGRAAERAMKAPARAPGLPEGLLEAIPDVPGLYLFHAEPEAPPPGRSDRPLFAARAVSLRARVKEHFAASVRKGRDAELREQVRRVEWIETAGELDAILREAELVKRLRPPSIACPKALTRPSRCGCWTTAVVRRSMNACRSPVPIRPAGRACTACSATAARRRTCCASWPCCIACVRAGSVWSQAPLAHARRST